MLTVEEVVDGLIAVAVADLVLGGAGILGPVLAAFGLSIDTSPSDSDLGELVGLKYLERISPPDGVVIAFSPLDISDTGDAVPNMTRRDFAIAITTTLKDYPGNPLQGAVGKTARFLSVFSAAVARLYGRDHLSGPSGGWTVTGANGPELLLLPQENVSSPVVEGEIRDESSPFAELMFFAYTIASNV